VGGGAGNDTVVVASDADVPSDGPLFTHGTLAGIQGPLTVDAAGGPANRLVVSNCAAAASQTVTVTNDRVLGLAPAPIFYAATGGHYTDGGSNDGILLVAPSVGGSTFDVQSTLAGSTTEIDGGGSADFFNVYSDAAGTGPGTPSAGSNLL